MKKNKKEKKLQKKHQYSYLAGVKERNYFARQKRKWIKVLKCFFSGASLSGISMRIDFWVMLNSSVYETYFLNEETMNQGSTSFIEAYRNGCCQDSLKI